MYWKLYSEIKTERFTIPKTPEDLRICDHWNLNSVENKKHAFNFTVTYDDLIETLFIKINKWNTLFTNYNTHNNVCFLFNNTDSHISTLTANYVFQAFEIRKKHNFYTIQLYRYFLKFILLCFDPEIVILKNKLVVVVLVN